MLSGTIHKQFYYRQWSLLIWTIVAAIFILTLTELAGAERLPIKTYTVADGLLRDTVYKIKSDSRGFLWFCTGEGISRFDGYAFTNFTAADGLPGGAVNDFLETSGGEIYVATDDGLARLNQTQVSNQQPAIRLRAASLFTVIKPENPQAKIIQVLFEDAGGAVWVGTSGGLYRLSAAGEFEAVNLGASKNATKEISVTAIIKDRRGALWIGTHGGGLFCLAANGAIAQFTTADGMPGDVIASLVETKDGKLWAGMRWDGATAGLVLLNPEAADGANKTPVVKRAFTAADGLPTYWIPAMLNTSDGKFWLATVGGLCEWQGENAKSVCKTYRAENDLCNNDVWSLAEDKDGNLWTGSRCGAKKIARYGFTTYGEPDGIKPFGINSIFENRNGELFATITNYARIIYRFDGSEFTATTPRLPPNTQGGWGSKQTVWQDLSGAWLVPTTNGLFRFAPETALENLSRTMPQKFSPATKGKEIFRTFEDSRGDIWIATWSGSSNNELWRWRREANVWEDLTGRIDATTKHIVTSFVEDRGGNLWIGTGADDDSAELIRYRSGEFKVFTETENLPDGWIRDLYVDHAGRLWMANNKHGLLRLDDMNAEGKLNLISYSRAEGLSSAGAYCVTEDAFGRIYIGSARGIDRLNPDTGQTENFTTADGLPASNVELAYRDRNNNLWFGTSGGLAKYTPEPTRQRQPPTILITALRIGGESQTVSILGEREIPNIELNADQRQISVDFTGLGASLGEQLKYEYRLNNSDWTRTNERTINFANLSAGNYQFEIRAVTADRIYSSPATLAFHIAAPIYLRPWFVFAAIALIALTAFAAYRYRLNKLLEVERTRTRIATDLHDDIGTNLSKISLLSEIVNLQLANQNTESNRLLSSIAEISRESVGSMADIVWAINPKRDSVLELVRRMRLHVEEIFLDKDVRVRFDAPDDGVSIKLSMNARRELFLIFKEAVSNAARHSGCKNIEIEFRLENNSIFLNIADDGKGFDISKKSDGNGLENMRSRAEKNGGKFEVKSGAERGTILKIRFRQN